MGEGNHPGLRTLPPVHELARRLVATGTSHALAVRAARQVIDRRRGELLQGLQPKTELLDEAEAAVAELQRGSPRRVLNATGVVIHTGLGRAPLPAAAQAAVAQSARGYCDLELDLATGRRGSRQEHVAELLCELTGAEAALAVNNGAGAVLLAVAALAGGGRPVVVSRGQLVEIGGGFRIPDVVAQSGARLVEVGTTNRTHLADYRRAVEQEAPAAILRVHQSNFRTLGFVAEVGLAELCALGVPVIDDIGSGVLRPGGPAILTAEPDARSSLAGGAALICCSADKLLGGPQAGLLLGTRDAIAAAAEHPLARALRLDKLSLAALRATLELHRDPERARREIPVLRMLELPADVLHARAAALRAAIGEDRCEIVAASARVGGGSLPLAELPGPAVAVDGGDPEALGAALRAGEPPVLARLEDGRLLLDPRTLAAEEISIAAERVRTVLEQW